MCEGQRGSEAVTAQGQGQKDEEGAGVALEVRAQVGGTAFLSSVCCLPLDKSHPFSKPPAVQLDGDPGYLPTAGLTAREEVGYRGGFGSGTCWDLMEVHRRLVAELIVFLEWAGGKAKGWAPV